MTLRTSCFDRGLFLKTVKRFWPLWAGYLLIWIMDLPVSMFERYSYRDTIPLATLQRYLLGSLSQDCVMITFIAAPLSAMAVFSHLYNDRSCGTYASLPLKRESVFLSVTLAGLVPLVLTHIVTFGVNCGVSVSLGHAMMGTNLTWLLGSVLELVAFYGFAVLCAQLTGHLLIAPAVYAVLSFTAMVVQLIVGALMELFLYGYSGLGGNFATLLTPVACLMERVGYEQASFVTTAEGYTQATSYALDGWGYIIAYAVAGLGCLLLSLVLYRKRRMETAGDVVAFRPLRPVFKYALAGGCALVLGMILAGLFYNDSRDTVMGLPKVLGIGLSGLMGGFIGYFGAEMLNRKTFRVFAAKQGWIGFGCFAAVLALALGILHFDLFGFETRLPRKDRIEAVTFSFSGDRVTFEADSADEALRLHKAIIDTRDAKRSSGYEGTRYITVNYLLNNGSTVYRKYEVLVNEGSRNLLRSAEDILNSPAARRGRGFEKQDLTPYWFQYCTVDAGDFQLSLSQAEAYEFYTQCILPDLRDGKLDRVWLLEDSVYLEETYKVSINMRIVEPVDAADRDSVHRENLYLTPTTESTRVNDWLRARNVPMTLSEQDEYAEKYGYLYEPVAEGTSVAVPFGTAVEVSAVEFPAEPAG